MNVSFRAVSQALLLGVFAIGYAHGQSQGIVRTADAVTVRVRGADLRLQVLSSRVIRVSYGKPGRKSFSVVGQPSRTTWSVSSDPISVVLRTQDVTAIIQRATGAVAFRDARGRPLLSETSRSLNQGRVRQSFLLRPEEAIYGLGQHQDGVMNYRGTNVHLQQKNTDVAVPVLLSNKGYGLLWDNPSITDVNVGAGDEEVIPASQLRADDGVSPGLTGAYFRGENFESRDSDRVDPGVDFDWTKQPPQGLPHDHYSVRWSGFVLAKQGGDYAFAASSDDGVRLWIDDKPVFSDWTTRAEKTTVGRVRFEANSRHRIRFEFYQSGGESVVRLRWRLPAKDSAVTWSSASGKAVDYYFMYGPDLEQVIADYRSLTGDAPMFGKWAWGFWQCRERYKTQKELLDVVAEYRRRHIPLDGIIQDWQYWSPAPWGSHAFDPARYPDPAALMRQLHAQNVHAIISVWPKFQDGSANAEELGAGGFLYGTKTEGGHVRWYDPFNPLARRAYWGEMSREIFHYGFDGWWLDASEPELNGNWGEYGGYATAAGSGAEVFNAFPLLHTTSVYQGQRAEMSDKRVFILTRSAYAGQQRNGAVTWSGDIAGTWDVFRRQIPAGLNFSMSGIPYWNTDTGGFFGGNPSDPDYTELFTRWFQFSAFCPMFRVHGTGAPKEMWRFDEPTQKILVQFDRLRYRLLPYIYSVSWQVTHHGSTMMRGLPMDFRNDPRVANIADQYLFGPSLMVNPVTTPKANSREVYLPAGRSWTDFWTGEKSAGGQAKSASAPIDRIPIYVPAGSILPMGPVVQHAEVSEDPIEIRVYAGRNGTFTLYEDRGDGYDYEKGAYATIPIVWNEARRTLTIGKREGSFAGMRRERTFRVVFVRSGHGVGVEPAAQADAIARYRGESLEVRAGR